MNIPSATNNLDVVIQDGHISVTSVSRYPVRIFCPVCQTSIRTQVTHTIGLGTWLIALLLCLLPPLCLVPFFIRSLKDTLHYCPHCGNLVGIRRLMWWSTNRIFSIKFKKTELAQCLQYHTNTVFSFIEQFEYTIQNVILCKEY